jgi:hypothetical protein
MGIRGGAVAGSRSIHEHRLVVEATEVGSLPLA